MFLAIDIGNTQVKCGVFDSGKLVRKESMSGLSADALQQLFSGFPVSHVIVASVADFDESLITARAGTIPVYSYGSVQRTGWQHIKELPLSLDYDTPHTLGEDRIAACAGARRFYQEKYLLVVTSGTCITYNVMDGMRFMGGAISPGLHMRYKALNHYTGKLPLLQPSGEDLLTGRSTDQSIHAGVETGLTEEVKGFIARYAEQYPGLVTVLSGGDSAFLQKRIKTGIFVQPDLELHGLNYIIEQHVR